MEQKTSKEIYSHRKIIALIACYKITSQTFNKAGIQKSSQGCCANNKTHKAEKGSSTTEQLIKTADELNLAIQQDKSKPDQVAGVLARVTTDQDH